MVTTRVEGKVISEPVYDGSSKFEKKVFSVPSGSLHIFVLLPSAENNSESPPSSLTMDSETSTSGSVIIQTFQDRLNSFTNSEWKLECITPYKMAKAGFHYTGLKDSVKCNGCVTVFENWTQDDTPLYIHKYFSPYCTFLKDYFGRVNDNYFANQHDVFNKYEESYSKLSPEVGKKMYQFLLSKVIDLSGLKYKQYSYIDIRLKSFNNCKIKILQDYESLSEAGFFYVGDGNSDESMCFYCGKTLKEWESDDNPWTEHAKWSPKCNYVLLCKGKGFVENVRNMQYVVPPVITSEYQKTVSDFTPEFVPVPNTDDDELENINVAENNTVAVDKTTEHNRRILEPVDDNQATEPMDDNQATEPMDDNQTTESMDGSEVTEPMDDNQATESVDGSEVTEPLSKAQSSLPEKIDAIAIPDSIVCKICFRDEMKMACIPCGHLIACTQCALTIEHCAVCRKSINMVMEVYVYDDKEENEGLSQLPLGPSQDPNQMLCKVCKTNEMDVVFIPCRHVYACIKCAMEIRECSVCLDPLYAFMQVYL